MISFGKTSMFACGLGLSGLLLSSTGLAQPAASRQVGRTVAESGPPQWPRLPEAPKGAPNVLLIMTDDVGFAASSTFGGPVPTPTLDALAKNGLRYNEFNTTALCSPTRAALLTGRNPHNVEMGALVNAPTGYEGYTTAIPKSAGTVAEILKESGYGTAIFGKSHITPESELSQAGPFDRWPTGLGFQYFYGFTGGDTNLWAPTLIENTTPVEPPHGDPDYHFDRDMADRTIRWIREQREIAPAKPFFVYYAPGTAHAPHHAPKEWIERFRGKFDQGWDAMREESFARQKKMGVIPVGTVLTPRPAVLPAWSSLSAEQKRVSARFMEAYAASLSHMDAQVGRVITSLKESGQLDNTLIIFIQGDNGASGEGGVAGRIIEQSFINKIPDDIPYMLSRIDEIGGPNVANNYPAGWAWAMNTPFQYYKQVASHFGGIRNGMVMSWPQRIKQVGGVREQFHFVSDITPTILEAAGITPPATIDGVAQRPLDGVSMAYTFDQPKAPSRRTTQVFEMVQNLGIYQNGWWAGTTPAKAPWDLFTLDKPQLDTRTWELYHVEKDFSQGRDLAKTEPAKLEQMKQLFWDEAKRNTIFPIHDPSEGAANRPSWSAGRTKFTYAPGHTRLSKNEAPHTIGRSFTVTADIAIDDASAQGVLVTQGGRFGGYGFYLKDGRLIFHYNAGGERQYRAVATEALRAGRHVVAACITLDQTEVGSSGNIQLLVDGRAVANGRIAHTLADYWHGEEFDVGSDTITAISDDYTIAGSRFTGKMASLTVEIR